MLRILLRQGNAIQIKPAQKHYSTVQIDEVWSFVGQRKKGKYWLFYAYSAEYDKILTYTCGSRSATTLQTLLRKLQGVNIDQYCTDYWKAFAKILPTEKHRIGKAYTKNIEGVNTCLIARNKRLVR
ncbi:IS1 family transposase [Adhaeribacter swui]|uniref:IS1 family transposase n=1 Tax=Adhaeribacter swui TaxID=2086471 RepID=A0A7G7GB65_9BACT|nr:IS1 family transposase [Adhaeribacter swui]